METSRPVNEDSSDDEQRDGEEVDENSYADNPDEPLEDLLNKVLSNGNLDRFSNFSSFVKICQRPINLDMFPSSFSFSYGILHLVETIQI